MKLKFLFLLVVLSFSFSAFGENRGAGKKKLPKTTVQEYINTQLKTDSLFNDGAVVGIYAIDGNGEVIADWNSSYPLLTASTLKTITTGVGLRYLGEDYKYSTKVGYTGEVVEGILNGDIHIIGGGDPTLGSKDTVAFAIDSIFGIWTDAIKKLGVTKINGKVIVDDRWMVREQIPDSWSWGNLGASYGSTASGLAFYENGQDFKIIPGKKIGDKATVMQVYPIIPNLNLINDVVTAESKTGDDTWYYLQDLSLTSKYSGRIGIDRGEVINDNSSRFPQLSCGYHFILFLREAGIDVGDEIIDILDMEEKTTPTIIAETFSPELKYIVNVTNRISNNFYAETIFKTIGKEMTGVGRYDSSRVAIKRLLTEYGVNLNGYNIKDGSGLSRQDFVTPKFFCNYYTKMAESSNFAHFLESFPVPGCGGTLKSVLKDIPSEIKGRIHAKSGSLSGVRCYAGYVEGLGKRGLIKFAILVNNFSAPTSKMQPKIEKFMLELAQCK